MKIILFANTDWYLYNFRLPLAKALREKGAEVVMLSPGGPYAARLEKEGFRWLEAPLQPRGTNPLSELIFLRRLLTIYQSEKPQIVHHFTIKCVLYGSIIARLAGVRKVVNSITGLGYVFVRNEFKARLIRFFVKPVYRAALKHTKVIFQNPDDQALFFGLNLVEKGQARLIRGSGVDTQSFKPEPEKRQVPLVVLPGRMIYSKGVQEFVDASRILRSREIPVRFALVGESDPGNPDAVPPAQLEKWQEEGSVECWGWREDMLNVYLEANIICLPSYREGLPKTLLEAAACGRALVAFDVPGCREIVRHGQNGLLVKARDVDALADAIQTLCDQPEERRKMGQASRAIVEQDFSVQKVVKDTIEYYNLQAIPF